MVEIINLRRARKARLRADNESQAEENRQRHGRTNAEKRLAEMTRRRLDAVVDGALRQKSEEQV